MSSTKRKSRSAAPSPPASPLPPERLCPETPQELFEMDVGEQQAAKMLGWPVDVVLREWERLQREREAKELEFRERLHGGRS